MTFRLSPTYRYFGLAGMVALEQGTTDTPANIESVQGKLTVVPYFWNPNTLAFEVGRQTSTAAGSTTVDANLTSAGSTKEVGYFRLSNPTTAVDATLSSAGSTRLVGKVEISPTTPGSSNDYLWTRAVGAGSGSTAVDATLTSDGSTRIVGKFELSPTTPGSSQDYLWMRSVSAAGAGSTEVDANLTSAGSTRLVGQITVANPTTSVTVSNPTTAVDASATLTSAGSTRLVGQVTVANPTTSVTVTSGTVLGPSTAATGQISSGTQTIGTVLNASSTGQIGSIALASGTTGVMGAIALSTLSTGLVGTFQVNNPTTLVNVSSGVVLGPSTAMTGMISSGTQQIGSVALVTGTTNTMGAMAQGAGSSANFWTADSFAFTSGQTSRSSVSTTVDIQIVAANANRKALVISNRSTVQTVGVGFSTAVVTTALANVDVFIGPSAHISFGFQGTLPNYLGPLRGINLTSTAVAGSVGVVQFLNT